MSNCGKFSSSSGKVFVFLSWPGRSGMGALRWPNLLRLSTIVILVLKNSYLSLSATYDLCLALAIY